MTTWHTGRLAAVHLHTTGLDPETVRVVIPDLIHLGGSEPTKTTTWLINPGIPIPEQASAIHGVTTEQAHASGEDSLQTLGAITGALAASLRQQIPLVVFRAPHALTVLDRDCRRHDLPTLAEQCPNGLWPVVDPLFLDKRLDRFRRGSRTLRGLCEHHRVRHDGDLNAASDALAAARLAWWLGHLNPRLAGLDVHALHVHQRAWAAEQAASLQEYKRRNDPTVVIDGSWPVVPWGRH
ncbi:3'-5' exonuclease [Streptomyces sp. NPDC047022]|uniref:3'-5' exonuclease n=1 Tax=Streptomyces sp. NPDC047022 TaxID=3155737 RepID=UPI0033EC3173